MFILIPEKNKMEISIIYGFRNRELERVQRSLNSLRDQSDQQFKVIFVDYGSDEKLSAALRTLLEQYPFCSYIYNETRGMPWNRAHALNTGIKLAETEYVFTSDVDVIFAPEFVHVAKELASQGKTVYFSIVYLTPGISYPAAINNMKLRVSDQHAQGLALVNRQQLEKIRGLDEFYLFWGHEDNDLDLRLKAAGSQSIFFSDERLLFHQWHATARESNKEIPEGWLSFQSDYLKYNQTNIIRNLTDWGRILSSDDRPAWKLLNGNHTIWEVTECKTPFLKYRLATWFAQANTGDALLLKWNNEQVKYYANSRATRYAKNLQNLFNFCNLPFSIRNAYSGLYPQASDASGAFIYFIAEHHGAIGDFAICSTYDSVKLVAIK